MGSTVLISQQELLYWCQQAEDLLWRGQTLPSLEWFTLLFPTLGRGCLPRLVEELTVETSGWMFTPPHQLGACSEACSSVLTWFRALWQPPIQTSSCFFFPDAIQNVANLAALAERGLVFVTNPLLSPFQLRLGYRPHLSYFPGHCSATL